MELPGEVYLFNLSLLAVTVAVISTLVMLVRQTLGGKLSAFDVYLVGAYISIGFAIALDAILPSVVHMFEPPTALMWTIASALAAVILAGVMINNYRNRQRAAKGQPVGPGVVAAYSLHLIAALLLTLNAAVPALQSLRLFAGALTLSLATLMWSFVRRIASLGGEMPSEDWDPKRG